VTSASFQLGAGEGGRRISLRGDWTAVGLGRAGVRLAAAVRGDAPAVLDVTELGGFDSAGALALIAAGVMEAGLRTQARPDVPALLALASEAQHSPRRAARASPMGPYAGLARLGRGVVHLVGEALRTFSFYGRLLSALGLMLLRPGRLRPAAVVSLMERAGLDALPIVAVTSFFVGATLAFMGQDLLSQYGGQVFTVELVGISVLREFGVLVTAIILAGRSASSFAAEIGAMRMNQEVDAMQVMGVDPFEALVIPRFLALLLMTPLLTFVAMVAGLLGGLLVIWSTVGLSPAFFLQRLMDNVGAAQFYLGMVKAPVLAMIIAAIGCRQGLEVGGDVESLGRRVTTAVVQALFGIILADAAFAFLFVEAGQ
jgi:phospholipid/cholesterol/gamma-HCH transport system permease protein